MEIGWDGQTNCKSAVHPEKKGLHEKNLRFHRTIPQDLSPLLRSFPGFILHGRIVIGSDQITISINLQIPWRYMKSPYGRISRISFTPGYILLLLIFLLSLPVVADTGNNSTDPATLLSGMTPEERVGQLFMPAISAQGTNGTPAMTEDVRKTLNSVHPGGVILFARDIRSPGQLVTLTTDLQKSVPLSKNGDLIPLFISVDQEGGYITRLPFGPVMPGNMALGAAGSTDLTRNVSRSIGEELRSLGINMNFAPVLDVETNQNNPVIGIRSFGSDPDLVAVQGAAYIKGMHDAGIICSGKHFPGHGDVDVDSHISLPLESHNKTRMNEVELVPFRAAIREEADAIMTAHIIFPAYDNATIQAGGGQMPVPATLSRPILTGLLRDELGFNGLIVTDAMMMKAISDNYGEENASVLAVMAGADIVLYPDSVDTAYNAVLREYRTNPDMQKRVDESVLRILTVKEKYGLVKSGYSGDLLSDRIRIANETCLGEKITAIERNAAEQSVTLLKDEDRILPLTLRTGDTIGIFAPSGAFVAEMNRTVREIADTKGAAVTITAFNYSGQSNLTENEEKVLSDASVVLLGTISTNATMRTSAYNTPRFAEVLIRKAGERDIPVIGFALNQPYDIMYMQNIPVYLATYAGKAGGQNLPASIRAVFGQIPVSGHLPVSIYDENGTILYPAGTGLDPEKYLSGA